MTLSPELLLTVASMLVAGGAAWGGARSALNGTREEIKNTRAEVKSVRASLEAHMKADTDLQMEIIERLARLEAKRGE